MYLLLYVHVCVTRTGWKTRPRPKTVILPIKKSNQIKSNLSLSLTLSLSLSLSVSGRVMRGMAKGEWGEGGGRGPAVPYSSCYLTLTILNENVCKLLMFNAQATGTFASKRAKPDNRER